MGHVLSLFALYLHFLFSNGCSWEISKGMGREGTGSGRFTGCILEVSYIQLAIALSLDSTLKDGLYYVRASCIVEGGGGG
jgi:hypothetical protein